MFSGVPQCTADTFEIDLIRQTDLQTRSAVIWRLGPTEVYENIIEEDPESRLTINAVKGAAYIKRKGDIVPPGWPRDMMLCLILLKETQKEEITS